MVKSSVHNPYVEMMYGDYKDYSFDERAEQYRGKWRQVVFKTDSAHHPMDLEVGTGNGTHFAKISQAHPERCFVGLELKYKTVVQSIRRCLKNSSINARMVRYAAEDITRLFNDEEINDVYIHFPDPWPKKKHHKNRLIQTAFLNDLYRVMKPHSFVEFKTDDWDYFLWARDFWARSPFEMVFYTEDLHNSFRREQNFVTHFESLFLKKHQPIFYIRLMKKN